MKTTIDIADDLLLRAKAMARREGTTFGAMIEEGLRKVLAGRGRKSGGEWIEIRSFRGKGLHEDAAGMRWGQIVDVANERHGDVR